MKESALEMSQSIIYRNRGLYRLVMNLLYRGRYAERFIQVCSLIRKSDDTILELCFGDVVVAEYCRQNGKRWIGLDASDAFVAHALKSGFEARKADLLSLDALPNSNVCIMMGSLYHFEAHLPSLFLRIKGASTRFILSEPVKNWTHASGLRGCLAKLLTRTDAQAETFRFTEASLTRALDDLKNVIGFDYRVASVTRDMIVEVVWSN
jgi:hypothetical protein